VEQIDIETQSESAGRLRLVGALKRRARALLPVPTLSPRRYAVSWCQDMVAKFTTTGDELLPPRRWMFDGSQSAEDFRRDGQEFLDYFIKFGSLRPDDRVLDIGSGIGRMTIPLTSYLDPSGRYDGFDIVKLGVDWCTANITPLHPNFRFQRADVFNGLYNLNGRQSAAEYRFPFADESFDFIFATSVFTHTLPDALDNYAGELARVLAPGGRAFTNFFIVSEESQRLIDLGRSEFSFAHPFGVARTQSSEVPEGAVAYPESHLRDLHTGKGLEIIEPLHLGSWCGRDESLTFQDFVVSHKPG
jgi:SAM-dependent methyltransferase